MVDRSNTPEESRSVISERSMDIIVALVLMAVAAVVMIDSYILGAGWAKFIGPESGYFPFYVALILMLASGATLVQNLFFRSSSPDQPFIHRHEALMVLQVLIPMSIFVVLTIYIGIYISAFLFISFFMLWLGKYRLLTTIPVALFVPAALFVVFEIWFLVPLPKGPLEAMFGY
jgi:putative tricarboxylic transport membrane protein